MLHFGTSVVCWGSLWIKFWFIPQCQDIALYFFVDMHHNLIRSTSSIYLSQCEYIILYKFLYKLLSLWSKVVEHNTTNFKIPSNVENVKLVFKNSFWIDSLYLFYGKSFPPNVAMKRQMQESLLKTQISVIYTTRTCIKRELSYLFETSLLLQWPFIPEIVLWKRKTIFMTCYSHLEIPMSCQLYSSFYYALKMIWLWQKILL